jgi:transcription-repair coupling factor (superfamily II helicase)
MLSDLLTSIQTLSCFEDLIESLKTNNPQDNLALPRAARLPVLAALHRKLDVPVLLITDRTDRALTLLEELALWAPEAPRLYFPEPNPLFYEEAPWGVTTRRDRLLALTSLASQQIPGEDKPAIAPIIVVPARAAMTRTLPRRDFLKVTSAIKPGMITQPNELVREWVSLGYENVNTVIAPGQFARRGGILDIWPPATPQPTRIEFFGDEIDILRHFDPTSQRTTGTHERLLITPAREYIASPIPSLEENQEPLSENDLSEFHIPLLHTTSASILDYLPPQALVLVDNCEILSDTIQDIEEQAISLRQDSIEDGSLSEDFPIPYLTWDQIQDSLPYGRTLELGPVAGPGVSALAERFTPNPRFGGQLKPLLGHIAEKATQGDQVIVVSRQSARLKELWEEQHPSVTIERQTPPRFLTASLSDGWSLHTTRDRDIHLLTDGEIFGWRRPQPRQRHRPVAETPEAAYADLKTGDWVVHADHGIGRFVGLVRRTIDQTEREYLSLEYAEGDQLFVPVHQADRLSRYVGPDSRPPSPTRLGGIGWGTARARVQKAVEDMAEELLELYARRSVVQGHAFSPDSGWQQELEASFPYIETEDQLRVLEEVKRDMEALRPMDRLICGDVGFGKTEVALRAAFKAIMDGKQVGVLVPTTVLAQQHFHTFRDRLAAFPVEVEMLSRFRTPQQQRDILDRLVKGAIDIVIGTHRLISKDVHFKDLGLLIIDEEQRFGVTHKETLKQMRTEVDVLTMTATPIPRTLYMSLTGVRDISTINTAPEERLPIITHVGPYSPRLVRRAVLRELERGGQVFFVHNRVQTIAGMSNHIRNLVPEARIGIAHGQMPETTLSKRMQEFTAGEIDILLSTSIIESGLDIPNANTLIIDRADTFGLAQLYQLRGRVGRGAQRAYAYFFKHKQRAPTIDGNERLETIAEHTQLGAGYSIAMRDLEIRGAGDILGTRQHGHIAAVGFHLYTRMLAQAVKQLRAERELDDSLITPAYSAYRPLVTVDLPLDTNLPTNYVPDKDMRLGLYRRLADVQSLDEVDALAEEFKDRFGLPPAPVENLLYQLKIKLLAPEAGLVSISAENGQIVLRYPQGVIPPESPEFGPNVRAGKSALWVKMDPEPEIWSAFLLELLNKLIQKKQSDAS